MVEMIDRFKYRLSKRMPNWLLEWYLEKFHGFPRFKPCAIQWDEVGCTEIILKDTMTIWKPWGPPDHSVDLGYDAEGNLIGIKVWDKVLKREAHHGRE